MNDDCREVDPYAVVKRINRATSEHDIDALVSCFTSDYESAWPVHPARTFVGTEQVRRNWAAVFDGVPDFRAELVRSAQGEDATWQEWYWHGTRVDGTRLEMRGVTIFGVQDDRILWGRLFMDEVDRSGEGIDQAVREITTSAE